MKGRRKQFSDIAQDNISLTVTVKMLERKLNRLQSQVDAMVGVINRRLK